MLEVFQVFEDIKLFFEQLFQFNLSYVTLSIDDLNNNTKDGSNKENEGYIAGSYTKDEILLDEDFIESFLSSEISIKDIECVIAHEIMHSLQDKSFYFTKAKYNKLLDVERAENYEEEYHNKTYEIDARFASVFYIYSKYKDNGINRYLMELICTGITENLIHCVDNIKNIEFKEFVVTLITKTANSFSIYQKDNFVNAPQLFNLTHFENKIKL